MRTASALNDQAMQMLQDAVSLDVTELELSADLKKAYRSLGADSLSFTPIIAFGANAALPHHDTGSTRLKPIGLEVHELATSLQPTPPALSQA